MKEAGRTGDLAFEAAKAALREVDRDTSALVHGAEQALETVRSTGDSLIRDAEAAFNSFVNAQKTLLYAAEHVEDVLVHSLEWIAYKSASGILDAANHATHGLDMAKLALEAAKKVADGTIEVAEASIEAALGALNITKVELAATLDAFLGGRNGNHGGPHFEVEVAGEIIGKPFTLQLKLNMGNTVQLIDDIFHA